MTTTAARENAHVLGVFAKWPERGRVKTRLAADDPSWCARVARAFLLDTLDRLAHVPARRFVVFAPREREADFRTLTGDRFELIPQSEGDLGQRLAGFVTAQGQAGASRIVVVGADSPTVPVDYVERAFLELERVDVVLGPATDGGYYLIGCGTQAPLLFEGVAWSSERVLADTVATLVDPRWRLAVLPPWYDVDTPADWVMLCGHLAALRRSGADPGVPHTEALIAERASACQ